jgi:DNA-binding transcriptional ArsR family regulator
VEQSEVPFPGWIDADRDLILTSKQLKGLSNPVRLQLLELLQQEGPATATSLAMRIGQSSGVTSYHLRVLAENEFIVEDSDRGNARDRFWVARHRSMGFTLRMPDDPESTEHRGQTALHLTVEEAEELTGQVTELVQRYRRMPTDPDPRRGTVRAYWVFRLLPDEPPGPDEPAGRDESPDPG